jgi:hypothetical protein
VNSYLAFWAGVLCSMAAAINWQIHSVSSDAVQKQHVLVCRRTQSECITRNLDQQVCELFMNMNGCQDKDVQ